MIEEELEKLSLVTNNPKKPFVVILGGAKISDKIGVVKALIEKADYIQELAEYSIEPPTTLQDIVNPTAVADCNKSSRRQNSNNPVDSFDCCFT